MGIELQVDGSDERLTPWLTTRVFASNVETTVSSDVTL